MGEYIKFPALRNFLGSKNQILSLLIVGLVPVFLSFYIFDLKNWDLTIPLIYTTGDDIWQLVLNKMLYDTGWILTNPFLGAPEVASWHHNAAAQTSSLHSVLMLGLSPLISDPVKLQQVYFLLNFPMISISAFYACRLLKINTLLAITIGILFSFTTFRMHFMLYSYLANYFMVPLVLVVIVWILDGSYSRENALAARSASIWSRVRQQVSTPKFAFGLVVVALMSLSDGYFSFFTLLLLGFAMAVRGIFADFRSPLALAAPFTFIATLLAVTWLMLLPLAHYKKHHMQEFYPGGIEDPALIKHPFEAEVYATSLKLLISPTTDHRIAAWGHIGAILNASSDAARIFKIGGGPVPLGILCSGVLLFAFLWSMRAVVTATRPHNAGTGTDGSPYDIQTNILLALTLFIFVISVAGGGGSILAMLFPTIRDYGRFPLFLIFVLYLLAASFYMRVRPANPGYKRILWGAVATLCACLALFDQIPAGAGKGGQDTISRFLNERKFVADVEADLPKGSMVYQYPYSQYLTDNKYYGWGSFLHVRLYIHSKALRWSNGASKNSSVDNWHTRIATLPFDQLLQEVEAVGFSGIVIDRSVVPPDEFQGLAEVLNKRGMVLVDSADGKLAYARLQDPGYRIDHTREYNDILRLRILDRTRVDISRLPPELNGQALDAVLKQHPEGSSLTLEKISYPEIFKPRTPAS